MIVAAIRQIHSRQLGPRFALIVLLVLCGEVLSNSLVAGALPPRPVAWGVLVAVALLMGGVATAVLDWLVFEPYRRLARDEAALRRQVAGHTDLELALAARVEQQRRLRHDIRGVLSPVLLVADRLLNHADPAVKRSGEIMVRTVDRATAVLAEYGDSPVSPPDGP